MKDPRPRCCGSHHNRFAVNTQIFPGTLGIILMYTKYLTTEYTKKKFVQIRNYRTQHCWRKCEYQFTDLLPFFTSLEIIINFMVSN